MISKGLKDDLLAAQVDALTGRLRTVINNLSTSWELEPTNEVGEAARGDAWVDQLCYLGATLRDRVRDALQTGVKRAMAVVCSGFSYGGGVPQFRH